MPSTRFRTISRAFVWMLVLFVMTTLTEVSSSFLVGLAPTGTGIRRRVSYLSSSSSEVNVDSAASTTTTTNNNDWWKSVKLEHEDVARETRADFPILATVFSDDKPLVYLDSAATSQKPNFVTDALSRYYQTQNSNVHRGAHSLSRDATAAYEEARDVVRDFIGASSRNSVIFTSGATQAINLIATCYGKSNLQKGDEIILSVMEHHSNLVPWQMLSQEMGVELKYVGINDKGGLDLKELQELLSEKTKLVSLQHVSNVMGCINPIEDIVKLVREHAPNAKILLDACQSVPHLPVKVEELGIDFLAASGHKACGPTGIGFLWGKEELLNGMPPFMGGGEMIDTVSLEQVTFAQAPARFEAGTPPIAQAIGMAAAFTYLSKIGLERIEAYEHEMGDYLYRRLNEVEGIKVLGPSENRAALCAFVHDTIHPSDLSSFLDLEGVAIRAGHHCCQPLHQYLGISHSARASLYFYNTKEDIDMFIEKLQNTLDFFNSVGDSDGEGSGEEDFVPFI